MKFENTGQLAAIAVAVATLAVAGCGGGSRSSSASTKQAERVPRAAIAPANNALARTGKAIASAGRFVRAAFSSSIAGLTSAAAWLGLHLLPPAAQASTGSVPGHRCAPLYPGITMTLTAFGTSCATAHALERRLGQGQAEVPARVAGRHWGGWYIYSQAHGHAHGVFAAVPGRVYVQLTTWQAEPQL